MTRKTKTIAVRAPFIFLLAALLTAVAARSSLARMLPFDLATPVALAWVFAALLVALLPALLARETPLPSAALVVVPVLVAGAYGASRLDWLRVLKDFGVAETRAIEPIRLALSALALLTLWALHAVDLAARLRAGALERGVAPMEARAASRITLRRNAQAAGIALAGAVGLVLVGILGLAVGAILPSERLALLAPLLAAAVLVAAAVYLARGRADA